MPIAAIPAIIGAGASIGGGLLSGQGKQQQQQAGTQAQTQTFDPATAAFRNQVMGTLGGTLASPLTIDPALLAQGVSGLNRAFGSTVPSMQSAFSSRGLGQSGLFGGSLSNLDMSRLGGIAGLLTNLQGTSYSRLMQALGVGMPLTAPTGTTGTYSGTGMLTGPGTLAGLGSGISDMGTLFGTMSAMGINPFSTGGGGGSWTGIGPQTGIFAPTGGEATGGF